MKGSILIPLFFYGCAVAAQNLVPNPGFDSITACPIGGHIKYAPPWSFIKNLEITSNNTPHNLYNRCIPPPGNGVPIFFLGGYQPARSGNGYARVEGYGDGRDYVRCYLQAPLLQPLVKNRTYYIRFFVNPFNLYEGQKYFYTDAIGIAFNNNKIDSFLPMMSPPPPVTIGIENRGTLLKDTMNWTKIGGCYTAKGDERYVLVGNFRTDAETLFEDEEPNVCPNYSRFFVEDILVTLFDPLPDTLLLCGGEAATFNAGFLDATYQWSTGETDSIVTINAAGQYVVEAFIDDCVLQDTMLVLDAAELQNFSADTAVCSDGQLILRPPMPGEYEWSDGSQGSELLVTTSGTYEVTVTNDCGIFQFSTQVTVEDCACHLFVPNAFSPNGDGVNDELRVFVGCDFPYLFKRFEVFDRWGSRLYAVSEVQEIAWDGTSGGKSLPSGVYVWFLEYEVTRDGKTERRIEKGDALILR